MEELAKEIYEEYLKPHDKTYSISNVDVKLMKTEYELKNSLNLSQRQKYEEIEYLTKKLNHENNIGLIEFVIKYLKSKKEG